MKVVSYTSVVDDGNMLIKTDPTNIEVINNRKRFFASHDLVYDRLVLLKTTYDGNDFHRYMKVNNNDAGKGAHGNTCIISDALVTRTANLPLFLPIADCIGATIFDPINNVLMLSHLGRHHLERKGGMVSIKYLVDNFGTNPKDIKIWLTPAPGKKSYPVFALNNRGMKEILFEQFKAAGVDMANVTDNPADTATDSNYFSHSQFLSGKQSIDGRYAMVAALIE